MRKHQDSVFVILVEWPAVTALKARLDFIDPFGVTPSGKLNFTHFLVYYCLQWKR